MGVIFYKNNDSHINIMKFEKEFPLISTKVKGVDKKFDLANLAQRREYFEAKVGEEIAKLKDFFKQGKTFIVYLLGKKNAGKGTYTKLLAEIFGQKYIRHISVGDIVRAVHQELETKEGRDEIEQYLEKNYRGYITVNEGIEAILGRSQDKVSVPNELMMALIKREIDKYERTSLFIDGFPRTLNQISYALFFKELIDYRKDPDFFATIDIPESVIDARMKSRVVCPSCQSPRNLKLFTTKGVGFDDEKNEFYLKCDNTECEKPGSRMIKKEGDDAGIESIRDRLQGDDEIINKVFSLQGVPKILLRNAIPVDQADELADDYEITPEFYYEKDNKTGEIKTLEKPWIIEDDEGVKVHSLMPHPVVVSFIRQLVKVLDL